MGREKGTGVKGERRRKMHGEENSITLHLGQTQVQERCSVDTPHYALK